MNALWSWWTQRPGWSVRQWMKSYNVWVDAPSPTAFRHRWLLRAIRGQTVGERFWVVREGPTVGMVEALYAPVVPWRWVSGLEQGQRYMPPWWIPTGRVNDYTGSELYSFWGTRWAVVAGHAVLQRLRHPSWFHRRAQPWI